jgi:hypothetical protein
MRANRLHLGDNVEATATVKRDTRFTQQLETTADRTLGTPNPFCDRINLATRAGEEREDLIGFTKVATP